MDSRSLTLPSRQGTRINSKRAQRPVGAEAAACCEVTTKQRGMIATWIVRAPSSAAHVCAALKPQQAVLAPGAATVQDLGQPQAAYRRKSGAPRSSQPPLSSPPRPSKAPGAPKAPTSRQQKTNGAGGSGEVTPQQLTQVLSDASTWQQLQSLCQEHAGNMSFIHAATAFTRLAKVLPDPKSPLAVDGTAVKQNHSHESPAFQPEQLHSCIVDMCALTARHAPEFQPRAVANALWATSKVLANLQAHLTAASDPDASHNAPSHSIAASHGTGMQAAQAANALISQLLDMLPQAMPEFEAQHHANALYALGLIHALTQHSAEQLPGQVPSERLQELGHELLYHSMGHLPIMTTKGIANMLWGAAQLGLQPDPAWMESALDNLETRVDDMEAQHVSTSLWALAKMGFYPGDEWLDIMLSQAAFSLPDFTCQGLANVLWALATLQAPVAPQLLTLLLPAVDQLASSFSPHDMSNTMWALASLQQLMQPPKAQPSQGSAGYLSSNEYFKGPQDNGAASPTTIAIRNTALQLIYGCSGLTGDLSDDGMPQQQPTLLRASPSQMANTIWAVSKLQLQPAAGWYQLFWRASYNVLPGMNSQEVANTLLALGRLGTPPPAAWWQRCEQVSAETMVHAGPQQLACTVWAMGELGMLPGEAWLNTFMEQVRAHRQALAPQAVACILTNLAKLQANVGPAWLCEVLNPPDSTTNPYASESAARQQSLYDASRVSVDVDGTLVWEGYSPKELVMVVWATARLLRSCETELGVGKQSGWQTPQQEQRHLQVQVCESLLPLLYALEQHVRELLPVPQPGEDGEAAEAAPRPVGVDTARAVALLTWSLGKLVDTVERWGPHTAEDDFGMEAEHDEHDEQVLLLAIMHALLDALCHAAAPCGPELTPGMVVQLVSGLSAAHHRPTRGSGLLRAIRTRITHLARARVVGVLVESTPDGAASSPFGLSAQLLLPTERLAAPGEINAQQLAFLIKALVELGCPLKPGWVQTCVELVRCLLELEGCCAVATGKCDALPEVMDSKEIKSLAGVMERYNIVLGSKLPHDEEYDGEAEEESSSANQGDYADSGYQPALAWA